MKLTKILSQHRRDFQGEYECEFCNNVEIDKHLDSYDDANYYQNVIPNMKCKKCNKSTKSENGIIDNITPRVPSYVVI